MRRRLQTWSHALRSRLPGGASAPSAPVRGQASVVALELDGDRVRIAEGQRRGSRGDVSRVAVVPLGLAPDADREAPEVLGPALARALKEAGFRPSAVAMGVPRAQVLLRTLTVPAVGSPGELAALVHFQLGRDLPFPVDQAVIDFQVVREFTPETAAAGTPSAGGSEARRVEVLVAAVKRDVVEFHRRVAEAAGFRLAALGWLSQANVRCLESVGRGDGPEPIALVTLRAEEFGVEVLSGPALTFSRGGAVRQAPGGDAAEWARLLTIEVVRTLHAYSSQGGNAAPARLFLSGATGQEARVAEALHTRLGRPVETLDLAVALRLPPTDAAAAAGGLSVLGLALGATDAAGLPFDFLNPKQPALPRDLGRIKTLGAVVAVLALLIGAFGFRARLVGQRMQVFNTLTAELREAEKKRTVYRQMQLQAATVDAWSAAGRPWLDHLAQLSVVLPAAEDLYATTIALGPGSNVRLGVQARSGEVIGRLDRDLRAAGYDVKPLAVNPSPDRHGYGFRSTVELTVPGKLTVDLASRTPPARPVDDVSLPAGSPGGAR